MERAVRSEGDVQVKILNDRIMALHTVIKKEGSKFWEENLSALLEFSSD